MPSISDWVQIGIALLLGTIALFVGVFGPYLAEKVKRRKFAPNLNIKFKQKSPFCHRTYWRSHADPSLNEPVFFFRFKVTNTGKSQAHLCGALLEELWVYDSAGKAQKISNFSPINLRYDERGTQFLDLNPERPIYWSIGHISSPSYQTEKEQRFRIDLPGQHANDELRFVFDLLEYPYSQPNSLAPGKYGIKVSIYSENAAHKPLYFEIAWSGKWQGSEEEMFREIVVTTVDRLS